MVPPSSLRISRVHRYSGSRLLCAVFAYETITLSSTASQLFRLTLQIRVSVLNPIGISTNGLAFFVFARHYSRNLGWFLFLRVLRCFSSPGSPPIPIWFSIGSMILHHRGFPIRKSTDRCLFTAPRGLSQLVTSFFGSWCQGIHLMLFVTWTYCSPILRWVSQYLFTDLVACFFTTLWWQNCSFLPFFFGKTNFYLFLLLSQYLFVCFIRFSMIICIHSISSIEWSVWMDSNHRPRAYQARALTCWAMSPFSLPMYLVHLFAILLKLLQLLVEMMGFEPMTPCLQGRCSPSWATPPY